MKKKDFEVFSLMRRLVIKEHHRSIDHAIDETSPHQLKSAMGDIVRDHGIERTARKAGLSRQTVYKMFSSNGNPTYKNLETVSSVFGLQLTVKPMQTRESSND